MEPPDRPPTLRFGPFLADLRTGELRKGGTRVRLQEKPLHLLAALAERQGQLVTRDELRKRLWPNDTFVDLETGLNTAVSKLRDALSDNAEKPRYIETIPRRGYRFVAAVTWVETSADAHTERSSAFSEAFGVQSIAVLPFENLSHDAGQDYLSDGMTEALITSLSKMGKLRVISRTSVMQYQKTRKPMPEIARALGVEFIVEGSVLRAGGRVRIAAQLIDGPRDQHVWAERYEEDLGEVLALLEQKAGLVASTVAHKIGRPAEVAGLRPSRRFAPEACQAYLRGRHEFFKFTEAGWTASLDWYAKAIDADPNFAPAYSAMAHAYAVGVTPIDVLPPKELFKKTEMMARKALSLDDSNPEARWTLGLTEIMHKWNWAAGEKQLRLALNADPNNATAWVVLSLYYSVIGENDLAISSCEHARLLDPFSLFTETCLHWCLYLMRRCAELTERLETDRGRLEGYPRYHLTLGACHTYERKWQSAIKELHKGVETSGGCAFAKARLGYAFAASGQESEARALYQEMLSLADSRYVSAIDFAVLSIGLGAMNRALEWLDRAYEERSAHLINIHLDPLFDPLRGHPRFMDLVRRVGLPASTRVAKRQ
jgi:TolB-like protein